MKKKTTDARKTSGSRREETTDTAGVEQQTVYIVLEHPWDHALQGLSTAGWNDPSAGSVGASAILAGTADRDIPRKRSTKTRETNRTNEEEGDGFTTHASSLCTQEVGKARP
jgi:hypothetical protein